MKYLKPSLSPFLLFELAPLIVTLILLSRAVARFSSVVDYINGTGGRWLRKHPTGESGFGFEYPNTTMTYTYTSTGSMNLYSSVLKEQTHISVQSSDQTSVSKTYVTSIPTSTPYTTRSGTFLVTKTTSLSPYVYGTLPYGSIYSLSGVTPTLEPRKPSQTPSVVLKRRSQNGEVHDRSLVLSRRAWGDDNAEEIDFYSTYSDAISDNSVWLGCFSGALFCVALRILATAIYFGVHLFFKRKHHGGEIHKQQIALHMANFILAIAVISFAGLLSVGVAAWLIFAEWRSLSSSDVRATLAFWAISCVTTLIVLVWASVHVHQLLRAKKETFSGSDSEKQLE